MLQLLTKLIWRVFHTSPDIQEQLQRMRAPQRGTAGRDLTSGASTVRTGYTYIWATCQV